MWPYTDSENHWLTSRPPGPALITAPGDPDDARPAFTGAAGDMGSVAARMGEFLQTLRNNPDLSPDDRARVLQMVIADSDRLDRIVGRLIKALEPVPTADAGGNGSAAP